MKNQIALSSGSLYTYGLNRFFEIAKKSGYSQIEICPDSRFDTQDPVYIKKLAKQNKVKIIGLHYMMEFFGVWGDHKNRIEKSINLAKKLKVKYLVIHSWEYFDPKYDSWILKNQKKIIKEAKPVEVVFENSTKSYDMEKPDKPRTNRFEAKEMKKFDSVLMDTSHVGTAKSDLIDFFDTLADKIKYIHFSDNNPKLHKDRPSSLEDRHLAPGKGKLPLRKFLRHLKKSGYKGIISIELIPDSIEAEKGEKVAIKNLQKARGFVEKYLIQE